MKESLDILLDVFEDSWGMNIVDVFLEEESLGKETVDIFLEVLDDSVDSVLGWKVG